MFYRLLFLLFLSFPPFSLRAESLVLKETECEAKLAELIDGSTDYIDVSVYAINNLKLVNALIAAHQRGVKVRILTDRLQAAGQSSRIWDLIEAEVPLRVHSHKKIMHTKVAVYDGVSVSSGSLNWTEPAVHKNEEVCDIFINEPEYAGQHQKLFDERWALNSQEKSDEWIREQKLKKTSEQAEAVGTDSAEQPVKTEVNPAKKQDAL